MEGLKSAVETEQKQGTWQLCNKEKLLGGFTEEHNRVLKITLHAVWRIDQFYANDWAALTHLPRSVKWLLFSFSLANSD